MKAANITKHSEPCSQSFPSKPCVLLLILPQSPERPLQTHRNYFPFVPVLLCVQEEGQSCGSQRLGCQHVCLLFLVVTNFSLTLGELSNFSTHLNVCLLYKITIQFHPLMEINTFGKFNSLAWMGSNVRVKNIVVSWCHYLVAFQLSLSRIFIRHTVSISLNSINSVKAQRGNYLNIPTFLHLREDMASTTKASTS